MPTPTSTINVFRLFVTKIHGGDYVHAGGEASVEMVMQKILSYDPSIKTKKILDVGCGFGGTANYLYQQGFKNVYGIDLDEAAIHYTKDKYPWINTTAGTALEADQLYPSNYFSLIYLFNVLYAIQDKAPLIQKFSAISKPGAILALFDYALGQKPLQTPLTDLANKQMYPLQINQFEKDLVVAGWEILEIVNLTSYFLTWYKTVAIKLSALPPSLKKEFSPETISKVKDKLQLLTELIKDGALSGTAIYAKKRK